MTVQNNLKPKNPKVQKLLEALGKIAGNTRRNVKLILKQLEREQANCKPHDFKKIMGFDKNYSPKANGACRGQDVLKAKACRECGFYAQFNGNPWENCFKCGEKMDWDRFGTFAGNQTSIFKCQGQNCGHEYEKT